MHALIFLGQMLPFIQQSLKTSPRAKTILLLRCTGVKWIEETVTTLVN